MKIWSGKDLPQGGRDNAAVVMTVAWWSRQSSGDNIFVKMLVMNVSIRRSCPQYYSIVLRTWPIDSRVYRVINNGPSLSTVINRVHDKLQPSMGYFTSPGLNTR